MSTTPSDWLQLKDAKALTHKACSRLHKGVCMARSENLTAAAGRVMKKEVGVVPFVPIPLPIEAQSIGEIDRATREWANWRKQRSSITPGGGPCIVADCKGRCPYFERAILPAAPRQVLEEYLAAFPDCRSAFRLLEHLHGGGSVRHCLDCGEEVPKAHRRCGPCKRKFARRKAYARQGIPSAAACTPERPPEAAGLPDSPASVRGRQTG